MIGFIRFLAMTPKEFASFPVRSGILTESECLAVLVNLNSDENWPFPSDVLSVNRKGRVFSWCNPGPVVDDEIMEEW